MGPTRGEREGPAPRTRPGLWPRADRANEQGAARAERIGTPIRPSAGRTPTPAALSPGSARSPADTVRRRPYAVTPVALALHRYGLITAVRLNQLVGEPHDPARGAQPPGCRRRPGPTPRAVRLVSQQFPGARGSPTGSSPGRATRDRQVPAPSGSSASSSPAQATRRPAVAWAGDSPTGSSPDGRPPELAASSPTTPPTPLAYGPPGPSVSQSRRGSGRPPSRVPPPDHPHPRGLRPGPPVTPTPPPSPDGSPRRTPSP